jgi:predicted DCC family thiol-disulfide oxidoreductase YuxK
MLNELNLPENKAIILFDGVCNFCNNTVNSIIKQDKNDLFRFVALQSTKGMEICKYLGIDRSKTDSIVLFMPGEAYYIKSEAALKIANKLGGFYLFLNLFSLLPRNITDIVYDYIAKNRYKWFGKKDQCMMPDAQVREKFLD